jgi:hypothetical protein
MERCLLIVLMPEWDDRSRRAASRELTEGFTGGRLARIITPTVTPTITDKEDAANTSWSTVRGAARRSANRRQEEAPEARAAGARPSIPENE